MQSTKLSDLPIGKIGRVISIQDTEAAKRLCSLGFKPDAEVVVVRRAPFGTALYVIINDHRYGLRISEADDIQVVQVK